MYIDTQPINSRSGKKVEDSIDAIKFCIKKKSKKKEINEFRFVYNVRERTKFFRTLPLIYIYIYIYR